MKKVLKFQLILCFLIILILGSFELSFSHPHVFSENSLTIIFDEEGMAGLKSKWVFDEYYSNMIIEDYDLDFNGEFDSKETASLETKEFNPLLNKNYFTHISINNKPFEIKTVEKFKAKLSGGILVTYEFYIPCKIKASTASQEIHFSQHDPEYYIKFDFASNQPVKMEGDSLFDIEYRIEENQKESFYFGSVHPVELILQFAVKGTQSPKEYIKENQPTSDRSFSLLGTISYWQKNLKDKMAELTRESKETGSLKPLMLLIIIAFVYGVIHAAGPGHGKVVTSSCLISRGWKYIEAIILGNMIALVHGITGILLVVTIHYILKKSISGSMESTSYYMQIVSYFLITLLGLFMLIRHLISFRHHKKNEEDLANLNRRFGEKPGHPLFIALVVGMIPCPGVVMVMLFCLSMNTIGLGIILALTQALGMAVTISAVGVFVVFGKNLTLNTVRGKMKWAEIAEHSLEFVSAILLTTIGILFLAASVWG